MQIPKKKTKKNAIKDNIAVIYFKIENYKNIKTEIDNLKNKYGVRVDYA